MLRGQHYSNAHLKLLAIFPLPLGWTASTLSLQPLNYVFHMARPEERSEGRQVVTAPAVWLKCDDQSLTWGGD